MQDAWFAALATGNGCEWITLDRDYARFPGLRWRAPFRLPRDMARLRRVGRLAIGPQVFNLPHEELLLRRKEMGFTLAPVLSVALILISIEVIAMAVALVKRGLASDLAPAASFAAAAAAVAALLGWRLHPKHKGAEQAGMLS